MQVTAIVIEDGGVPKTTAPAAVGHKTVTNEGFLRRSFSGVAPAADCVCSFQSGRLLIPGQFMWNANGIWKQENQ